MTQGLSEEQALLKESADRFIERDYPFEKRRELAASEDGFSREVWAQLAEFGWLAAPLPEEHGGIGGSLVDVAVLMEAMGRGLVVEPYLSSVVLGGGLVAAAGSEAQKAELLPALGEGRLLLAFAYAEPQARYDLFDQRTTAQADGGGYRLDGQKGVVLHAATADKIIVSARTAGDARDRDGIGLFLVDRDAAGVALRPYRTIDGLRAAELQLDGVVVDAGAALGPVDGALPAVEAVIDRATIAVCAEAAGAMAMLVGDTRDYLKTRQQFGVPIGSFQVLQHRVVDMFMAHELARALTYRAAAVDNGELARAASAAKVETDKAGRFVGQNAVQLHGGMGMTDELRLGHYFKRVSMIGTLFGDHDHHLARFAALSAEAPAAS